jgi:hypothetical protein
VQLPSTKLQLPPEHWEVHPQRGLAEKLEQFLIELGRDFCFVRSASVRRSALLTAVV